ncbi:MAG: Gfo/Idh/MocA family oxidoreductase [Clostridia bacterium]|nr:Gfo/Idh/MocA family oxidoreductase [Clostridia bacterium]MBQ8859669.1 Gfo/Idh/MocA family oxidoreductase [Clostridia bacterium]
MYKFGILGCGMIANIHADAVKELENATLCGAADHSPAAAERFAEKHGCHAYASYAEMLADGEIDAVCICTPSGFHAENAIAALEAGKHVVLEKPMALSTADADRIIETCDRTGKLLTVISQLRFAKDIQWVKRLIADGSFGRISLCGLHMKYYRAKEYYSSSPWKGTLKFDGGGALMNQGIHGIDLLEYLVGPIKAACGKIATLCHDIEVEDTAVATVEFESGALGLIEGSTCAYPGFERRIEIHGDEGYVILRETLIEKLMIGGREVSVESLGGKAGTASDPTALGCHNHRMQMENLLAAIEGREKLLVDCREGKKAIRVIESIYHSSAEA